MKRLGSVMFAIVLLLSMSLTPSDSTADSSGPRYVFMPLLPNHWTVATPAVTVRIDASCSQFDAPGNDRQALDEEYVCFRNDGVAAVQLHGCRVQDAVGYEYVFPALVLASGATLTLHTGEGEDTATDLYWGLGHAVWNNDGDTVSLYDAVGTLVDQYTY